MARRYTIKDGYKYIKCVDFSSFTDQLNFIKSFVKQDPFQSVVEVSHCDNFYGKHTFEESMNGMLYGFKEDTKYLVNTLTKMKAQKNTKEGIFLDEQGFAYDMGSVVAGEPECCLNMGLPSTKPCIRILVDIAFSSDISANEIMNRGVAITNLIHTLLINGAIVELYLYRYNIQNDMDILYTTKIDVNILPIDSIAFSCSPECFRKVGWVTTDCIRERPSSPDRGRSCSTNFLINKIQKEKWFFIGGNYTDNRMKGSLYNVTMATALINNMFRDFCEENKIHIDFMEE